MNSNDGFPPRFDIDNITAGMIIGVIGYKNVGKAYLIKNILHVLRAKYNVDIIIISPNEKLTSWRKKDIKYPISYRSTNDFLDNKVSSTSKSVLIIEDIHGYDYNLKISDIIASNCFHNMIITMLLPVNTGIDYDIVFSFRIKSTYFEKQFYDIFIKDEKHISLNDFYHIIEYDIYSYLTLVIQNDKTPMMYCAENPTTLVLKHIECDLHQDRLEMFIHRIKSGYSMFHNCSTNRTLYLKSLSDLFFVKKCHFLWMCMKLFDPFVPTELCVIICDLMVRTYDKQPWDLSHNEKN